jgi:membrane-bound lytic murein transglycosylase B
LAGRLAASGLDRQKLLLFFSSPELTFNPAPMTAKLKELFGIYFRSDLTKSVQEKLFQLGFDLTIDGRLGSGTKKVIETFQTKHGLSPDGRVTDSLDKRLTLLVATSATRSLADYKHPSAVRPSRVSTYSQFTNPSALKVISEHYRQDKSLFEAMERRHGVPGPLVASIMWIETGYGKNFGQKKAAFSLASMAASADYSLIAEHLKDIDVDEQTRSYLVQTAQKRGSWAQEELKALLNYAWKNRLDPASFPGSIYGAIGYGQFMPSNIDKFAEDGDEDGQIDLFNKADAIFSIGRYLKENGWRGDMKDENQRRQVIMRYNRSGTYVNTVLYVARHISG